MGKSLGGQDWFFHLGFHGVGFVLTHLGVFIWAGFPSPTVGSEGTWHPGWRGVHVARKGVGQGPPWSRYCSRCRLKGMPAVRSSSSLSSRTVMLLRQFVTRNISPESSSSTRMAKTSGTTSVAWFTACGSPTWLRPRVLARSCRERGRGPAESAHGVGGPAAAGSGRMVPPGGVAASAALLRMARHRAPAAWPRLARVIRAPRSGRASLPPPPLPRTAEPPSPRWADGPQLTKAGFLWTRCSFLNKRNGHTCF